MIRIILAVLLVMGLLWVAWYLTGGPGRYDPNSGPYINPSFPLGDGQSYW